MIDEALDFIYTRLKEYLESLEEFTGDIKFDNIGSIDSIKDKIILSLINVSEEKVMKNTPHYEKVNDRVFKREPPVFVNIYLLITFGVEDYKSNLTQLSKTIEYFQESHVYTVNKFPELAAVGIKRLMFDLMTVDFEQVYNLWSVLGGSLYPFLMYRVRVLKIEKGDKQPSAPILEIDTEARRLD